MKKLGQLFKLGLVDDAGTFHVIAYAQKDTLEGKTDTEEVSSPNSGTSKNYMPGLTSWSFSHDGFWGSTEKIFNYGGELYSADELLFTLWLDRRTVTLRCIETNGWMLSEGTAIIEHISSTFQVGAYVKLSVKLKGSGELKISNRNNQNGHFVVAYKNGRLTLYAQEPPMSGCTIAYDGHDLGEWTPEQRTVQFVLWEDFDVSLLSAHNAEATMENVTFEDATRLHLVLLTYEDNASPGQQAYFVTPYWWNLWNLSNIVIHYANHTSQTLETAFLPGLGSRTALTQPPANITSVTIDGPQILDCCDITEDITRSLTLYQTTRNSAFGGDVVLNSPLACDLTVILTDSSNNIQASGVISAGETSITLNYQERITSETQISFRFEDREIGVSSPYIFSSDIEEDLDNHAVYYAINTSTHKITIYCPDQLWPMKITTGGEVVFSGLALTPQTFDYTSFTGFSTDGGSYTFNDASNITLLALSSQLLPYTFAVDTLPLSDIILLDATDAEVARIPALTPPGVPAESSPAVSEISSARMDSGSVQTLTLIEFERDVMISTKAEQTQNGQWTVTAYLKSQNSSTATTLPAALVLRWAGVAESITIPAGQSSATGVVTSSPTWLTPDVVMGYFALNVFQVAVGATVDVTPTNWKAYKLGTLSGFDLYDIEYVATLTDTVSLSGSGFTAQLSPGTSVIANHLFRQTAGTARPSIYVRLLGDTITEAFPVTFGSQPGDSEIVTGATLKMHYAWVYDNDILTAILSNEGYLSATSYSRHSNIAEVLPCVRVRDRTTQAPIYGPVSLEGLKPGNPDAFRMTVRINFPDDMNDREGVVEFSPLPTWGSPVIEVDDNLTGVEFRPYWGRNPLPFA